MIIIKLFGGLGNQMFQYAFGRNIAEKNQTELKLDITYFETSAERKFVLDHFNIKNEIATQKEIFELTHQKIFGGLKFSGKIEEKGIQFNKKNLKIKNNRILTGYWQCENYFSDIKSIIRNEFTIINPPDPICEEYYRQINTTNSVSIHIRRGDYTKPELINIHGLCDMDYYNRSIERISKSIIKPVFYVFSDNLEWAKNNLQSAMPMYFVDLDNGGNEIEDFRLMMSCKHNIIANSTFSWWAAWLNRNQEKIIIAPKFWFSSEIFRKQQKNIIPDNWIKM